MKIYSSDKKSWLGFKSMVDEEHDYSSFLLEVFVDLGHSFFQGKNTDLHFFCIDDFISQLNAFILDRSLQPRLEGTYDTYLMFKGEANNVILSFYVGSAYCGKETYSYAVQGAFDIDQENLNDIVKGFSKYL
jgi:hypothetical protein